MVIVMNVSGDQTTSTHVFTSWDVAETIANKIIDAFKEQTTSPIEVDSTPQSYIQAYNDEGTFNLEVFSEEPTSNPDQWVEEFGAWWGISE